MIFYQNRDRQYEKPCSGYPNKEEKTYKPFVVPQKDTEHYFQAFKSYNTPELSENPLSFSAVKIRQVHEKVPADESPIDIHRLIRFYMELDLSPRKIRDSIKNLSWKEQMMKVINNL